MRASTEIVPAQYFAGSSCAVVCGNRRLTVDDMEERYVLRIDTECPMSEDRNHCYELILSLQVESMSARAPTGKIEGHIARIGAGGPM